MKILIDNGHGIDTPGKRSPDGRFREYKYNREIAKAVVEHLQLRGYDAVVLTENGFMDSEVSLAFLESDEGKNAIIALHVDGIENFIIRRSHEPL